MFRCEAVEVSCLRRLCAFQMVTMDNAEEYVELMFDLCMHTGIQKQMEAFRGKHGLGDGLCSGSSPLRLLLSSAQRVSTGCFPWRS